MNAITKPEITLVEKEEIFEFIFPRVEVLDCEIKRNEREERIRKAKKLGNSLKGKVKIIFEDTTSLKKVETTIWGVTEKNIILKRSTLIPIHRIHEIKFF
jgi:uncharacterized protein (UPF0248 family)